MNIADRFEEIAKIHHDKVAVKFPVRTGKSTATKPSPSGNWRRLPANTPTVFLKSDFVAAAKPFFLSGRH